MKKYKMMKVFVPGGLPELTYISREELSLEDKLKESKDNLCKLVLVTGLTKSGKTVLATKIFPKNQVVWCDGGSFSTEDDFWAEINDKVSGFTEVEEAASSTTSIMGGGEIGADAGLPFLKAKTTGKTEIARSSEKERCVTRKISNKTAALTGLKIKNLPIIIDDFHYIPRDKQGLIVRALKPLIFEGLPVILIAIPHRRLDVVKVEREMTARIERIDVPTWSIDELKMIAQIGFPLLNIKVNDRIIHELSINALGSPHLMQEFCRELCRESKIMETKDEQLSLVDSKMLENVFKKVAENTGKLMFEKLKRGPRSRTDRIQRKLKSGETTDIYGLVLHALAEIRPGIESLNYETIRSAIKNVCLEAAPQAHEISRVLEKMSKISTSDESSTPVIDWEKDDRILHITDPYFAYYLKWGLS